MTLWAKSYANRSGAAGISVSGRPEDWAPLLAGSDADIAAAIRILAELLDEHSAEILAAAEAEEQARGATWSENMDECPHTWGETGRGQCRKCGADMLAVGHARLAAEVEEATR